MKEDICKCPCSQCGSMEHYTDDELLAVQLNTGKYTIIHIPCGKKADENRETV
jgi:hypothetical protein